MNAVAIAENIRIVMSQLEASKGRESEAVQKAVLLGQDLEGAKEAAEAAKAQHNKELKQAQVRVCGFKFSSMHAHLVFMTL